VENLLLQNPVISEAPFNGCVFSFKRWKNINWKKVEYLEIFQQ